MPHDQAKPGFAVLVPRLNYICVGRKDINDRPPSCNISSPFPILSFTRRVEYLLYFSSAFHHAMLCAVSVTHGCHQPYSKRASNSSPNKTVKAVLGLNADQFKTENNK